MIWCSGSVVVAKSVGDGNCKWSMLVPRLAKLFDEVFIDQS